MTLSHPLITSQALTSPHNPEQHEGRLTDGRAFYFRYRWGWAELGVGADSGAAIDDSYNHGRQVGGPYAGEFVDDEQRNTVFGELLAEVLS